MPRKERIDAPGALQHIIIRGIEGKKTFFDDGDRNDFLDRLGDIVKDTSTLCYAWALGESATSLANKLRISQPAVSMSVIRGEEIVKDMGIELLPKE